MFFIVMLPIFPQLDPNGLHQRLHFIPLQSQVTISSLIERSAFERHLSSQLFMTRPPESLFLISKNQRFRQFESCLQRRRERIISTNRILKSFLERLRPKSVPFSDLIRRSFFGKIDTITLNSFRLECEHLDDTNLYIAIGFYLLFETFRCVLRQKDNDRDKNIISSIRRQYVPLSHFFPT